MTTDDSSESDGGESSSRDVTQEMTNSQAVTQNVNVSIEREDTSPSIVLRGVYFLLFGWWASGVWLSIAWLLNVTVVGMPLGIRMINKVPKIVSLKDRRTETKLTEDVAGQITVSRETSDQYSLLLRTAYFLLVGWWASAVWTAIAWLVSITIVGLPIAVWMYDRLPFVVSLYKY